MNKVIEVTMSMYHSNNAHFIHIQRQDRKRRCYHRVRDSKRFNQVAQIIERVHPITVSYLGNTTFINHSFEGEK